MTRSTSTLEDIYLYFDSDGIPVARKLKLVSNDNKKRFVWEHSEDGGVTWEKGRNGHKGLFRTDRGSPVQIITEGEKDAITLWGAGFSTASLPDGAGSTDLSVLDPLLEQEEPVEFIFADRDKAGRAHARRVYDYLREAHPGVRIVEPWFGKDGSEQMLEDSGVAWVDPIAATASRLGARQTDAATWQASCPVPDHGKGEGDRNPSLTLELHPQGFGYTVKCWAGCEERDIRDALAGMLPERVAQAYRDWSDTPKRRSDSRQSRPQTRPPSKEEEPFARPLSSYGIRRTRLTFDGRIELGAVNLLVGIGGTNKSSLTAKIAADATLGKLDGDLAGKPINVLIASAEDGVASTIHPRLVAQRADTDRVFILNKAITLPDDIEELATYVRSQDIGMVIVDPLVAFLESQVDTHKDGDIRRALRDLVPLAEERGMTTLGVVHLNKTRAGDIYTRITGSVAFYNLPRSVMAMTADPQAPGDHMARVLWHPKANNAPLRPPQSVTIRPVAVEGDDGPVPTIVLELGAFLDGIDIGQVLGNSDARSRAPRRDEATEALRKLLSGGPADATVIWESFAGVYSKNTVNSAADQLGVEKIAVWNEGGGIDKWIWQLPEPKIKLSPDRAPST